MYLAKIFRILFPNICVSQPFLITSSRIQFQTMSSQGALSSVFSFALKILCSTFKRLYLFECFLTSLGSLQRRFSCSFCVGLCYTLEGFFFPKNKNKRNWNNYFLLRVRKSFFHVLLGREDLELLNQALTRDRPKKAQIKWLCGTLESCSKPFLGHDQ